ncbi:MAG: metallophosphoesterase, partial [Deltaproteobacteria bacterium]
MSAVETAFILAHELAHIKLGHLERMTGAGAEFAANSAAIDLMTAAGYGREEAIRAGMSVIAKLTGWRQEAKAAGKIVVDEALDREHQETHPYEEMSEALGKLLDGGLVFAGADDFFKAVDRRDIRDAGAVIARVRQAQERIDGLRRSGVIKGNLASIRGKVIPIGDIHGDAAGLERYLRDSRFFERKAAGEDVKLLFLGDFVDRDRPENQLRALEIVTLLLQSCAPGDVILLAGNHEHNGVFNKELVKKGYFKYEIPEYYGTEAGAKVIAAYQALFNDLPFACLVNDEGFAVHGGIPKGGSVTLEQIRDADNDTKRGFELLRALVWNDPDILATESRGDGPFTEKDIDNFLAMNRNSKGEKLRYVIRGHQPVRGGLVSFFNGKLINVFCNTVYYGKDVGPQVAVCELREGAEPLADGGGILKDDALAAGKGIYATTLGRDKIDGIKDGAMIIEVGGRVETINMRYSGLDYSSSLAEVDRNFAQLSPEGKAKEIASAAREWAKVPENKGKPFRFLDLMCGDGTTIGQIYDELKKTGVFDEVAVEMYGLANTYCAKWKELSDTKGIRFILASAADVGLFFKENVNFVLSHKGLHLIETRDYSMLTRISAVLVEGGALYVMPVPFWGQYPDAAGRMSDWLGAVYSVEGKGLAAKLRKTASADHAGQADGGTKGGVDFRTVPIRGPSRPSLASAAPGTEEFTPEMAKEWRDIRMMVGRNLEPSPQRFAEFVSNARRTKAFGAMSREIAVCFAEMLRLEECNDIPSDRAVKDILELLPSA